MPVTTRRQAAAAEEGIASGLAIQLHEGKKLKYIHIAKIYFAPLH